MVLAQTAPRVIREVRVAKHRVCIPFFQTRSADDIHACFLSPVSLLLGPWKVSRHHQEMAFPMSIFFLFLPRDREVCDVFVDDLVAYARVSHRTEELPAGGHC